MKHLKTFEQLDWWLNGDIIPHEEEVKGPETIEPYDGGDEEEYILKQFHRLYDNNKPGPMKAGLEYKRFIDMIMDETEIKDYYHVLHILSKNNLLW